MIHRMEMILARQPIKNIVFSPASHSLIPSYCLLRGMVSIEQVLLFVLPSSIARDIIITGREVNAMKLNPDCIRDLLLDVEENTSIHKSIMYVFNSPQEGRLAKYTNEEVEYHLEQCDLNGYFVGYKNYVGNSAKVDYLSPSGHAFLSDVRSDSVWQHTKAVAGKIGAWSLDTLNKIAVNVVSEIIKRQITGC